MKDFLLFVLPDCPYCRRALRWQEEIFNAHPEYRDLPLQVVDESTENDVSQTYDYYYVPCYFWGKEKLAEGVLSRHQIQETFQRVWDESQANS